MKKQLIILITAVLLICVGFSGCLDINSGVFETNQEILYCRDIWNNSSKYLGERITVKAQWRGWESCRIGDTINGGIILQAF